jgi:LEA14-like dessication related protein
MSSKKPLLILGIFVTAFFIVANVYKNFSNTINDLKYKFTSLKFDWTKSIATGLSELFFTINLVLTNNHSTTINVNGIYFDVLYNNIKLATVQNTNGISISPNNSTINLLDLQIETDNLPGAISNALKNLIGGNSNFSFTFVGTIETTIGTFPVKQNLNIGS